MSAVIDAGVAAFRRDGFEATSLDALTRAMGISRSSFYAAFGSKHGVLIAALEHYSSQKLTALGALGDGPDGLRGVLRALAGIDGDKHGCLMVNCLTELAPRDGEVAAIGARHLERVAALVEFLLPSGPEATHRARALLALALGAQTLAKTDGKPGAAGALLDYAIPLLSSGT